MANTQNPQDPSVDIPGAYVATTVFDLLLVELVPMTYRIAADLAAKEEAWLASKRRSLKPNRNSLQSATTNAAGEPLQASKPGAIGVPNAGPEMAGLGVGGIGGTAPGADEEELRETVFYRLELIGYRVGVGITEKFSRDRPRFTDPLDVIKFLCKDLWTIVFKKQIDNLKTNHRGVYVLTDNNFQPLKRMSLEKGREGMMAQAQPVSNCSRQSYSFTRN